MQVLEHKDTAMTAGEGAEEPEHRLAYDHQRRLPRGLARNAPLRDESTKDWPKRGQL
jgi:hypothetical protein